VGTAVTRERLGKVETIEAYLRGRGYRQVRARLDRDDLARIETGPDELARLLAELGTPDLREALLEAARASGVARVSVDVAGYARPGES
jgi:uncharacterized protein